jgi:hypothetical protein
MVPPLRYRAEIVKALLVPDLGPIRPRTLANRRRSERPMVNHY